MVESAIRGRGGRVSARRRCDTAPVPLSACPPPASNRDPPPFQSGALPPELGGQVRDANLGPRGASRVAIPGPVWRRPSAWQPAAASATRALPRGKPSAGAACIPLWTRRDSNPQPPVCRTGALPVVPQARGVRASAWLLLASPSRWPARRAGGAPRCGNGPRYRPPRVESGPRYRPPGTVVRPPASDDLGRAPWWCSRYDVSRRLLCVHRRRGAAGVACHPLWSSQVACQPAVAGGRHGRQDSNLQPSVLETGALPVELRPYAVMKRAAPVFRWRPWRWWCASGSPARLGLLVGQGIGEQPGRPAAARHGAPLGVVVRGLRVHWAPWVLAAPPGSPAPHLEGETGPSGRSSPGLPGPGSLPRWSSVVLSLTGSTVRSGPPFCQPSFYRTSGRVSGGRCGWCCAPTVWRTRRRTQQVIPRRCRRGGDAPVSARPAAPAGRCPGVPPPPPRPPRPAARRPPRPAPPTGAGRRRSARRR